MKSVIKHLRDVNRRPFATIVVMNDNGVVKGGVAVCNGKDMFHKQQGVEIATGRAYKNRGLSIPSRDSENKSHPVSVNDLTRTVNWFGQELPIGDVITEEYMRVCSKIGQGTL